MKQYILMIGIFLFSVILLDCIRAFAHIKLTDSNKALGCIGVAFIIYGLLG